IEDEIDNLFESDNDKKNLISFIIGGSIHVLEKNKVFDNTYDYENVNRQLEELSKSIFLYMIRIKSNISSKVLVV
ncbi:MAG: hypothetical protein MR457_00400, partial [Solobacterium sp.]|nr:hypothetical protein [Solobacterium sp.]